MMFQAEQVEPETHQWQHHNVDVVVAVCGEMQQLCQQYITTPPPVEWEGVEVIHEKF